MGFFRRLWYYLLRIEEAYSLFWWAVPLVPGGFLGYLANSAGQAPHIVGLFVLSGYTIFSAGQYFAANNVAQHGIKNRLVIGCGGLMSFGETNPDGTVSKKINVVFKNRANVPLSISPKATLTVGGRQFEDDNFDPPSIISAGDNRHLSAGPVLNVPPDADDWRLLIEVIYGRAGEGGQKYKCVYRAKSSFDDTFTILEDKHELVRSVN